LQLPIGNFLVRSFRYYLGSGLWTFQRGEAPYQPENFQKMFAIYHKLKSPDLPNLSIYGNQDLYIVQSNLSKTYILYYADVSRDHA